MAGGDTPRSPASSPARRGASLSSSTTRRRSGSASARNRAASSTPSAATRNIYHYWKLLSRCRPGRPGKPGLARGSRLIDKGPAGPRTAGIQADDRQPPLIFYAAAGAAWPSGRSTSLPFSKRAPARTRATRRGAFTARQRACADSMSLNAIARPAAREPGPLVILVRCLWVPETASPYATWAYSRMRPPRRSRRRTRMLLVSAGGWRRPAGGSCCSDRCGRCPL